MSTVFVPLVMSLLFVILPRALSILISIFQHCLLVFLPTFVSFVNTNDFFMFYEPHLISLGNWNSMAIEYLVVFVYIKFFSDDV